MKISDFTKYSLKLLIKTNKYMSLSFWGGSTSGTTRSEATACPACGMAIYCSNESRSPILFQDKLGISQSLTISSRNFGMKLVKVFFKMWRCHLSFSKESNFYFTHLGIKEHLTIFEVYGFFLFLPVRYTACSGGNCFSDKAHYDKDCQYVRNHLNKLDWYIDCTLQSHLEGIGKPENQAC